MGRKQREVGQRQWHCGTSNDEELVKIREGQNSDLSVGSKHC